MKIRLNRYLSICGVTSRRKSEDLIKSKKIKVNGEIRTELQTLIDTELDTVLFDGIRISTQKHEYYKMNKPRFCLTTMSTKDNKRTVEELLPKSRVKLFPVGRLDYDTEGLLLFTNDGEMAHRISHPSFLVRKIYLAHIRGKINQVLISKMRKGAQLRDGSLIPEKIDLLNSSNGETLIKIQIHEGRNHVVKNFFKFFGKSVKKLKRIAVGPIELGELESGKITKLDYNEQEALQKLVAL